MLDWTSQESSLKALCSPSTRNAKPGERQCWMKNASPMCPAMRLAKAVGIARHPMEDLTSDWFCARLRLAHNHAAIGFRRDELYLGCKFPHEKPVLTNEKPLLTWSFFWGITLHEAQAARLLRARHRCHPEDQAHLGRKGQESKVLQQESHS